MNADQIRNFTAQALLTWKAELEVGGRNPLMASLNLQSANLLLMSEIAAQLAERNHPRLVRLTCNGVPFFIDPAEVKQIDEMPDHITFIVIDRNNSFRHVDGTVLEVARALGFATDLEEHIKQEAEGQNGPQLVS